MINIGWMDGRRLWMYTIYIAAIFYHQIAWMSDNVWWTL